MNTIQWLLESVFVYGVYPVVIVMIVAGMGVGIERAVRSSENRMRPLIGAVLPFAILGFLMVTQQGGLAWLAALLKGQPVLYQLIGGACTAIVIAEAARSLLASGSDRAYAFHALILSSNAAFIIWVVMSGALDAINAAFLGYVALGGLWVIFRGFPVPYSKGKVREEGSESE